MMILSCLFIKFNLFEKLVNLSQNMATSSKVKN